MGFKGTVEINASVLPGVESFTILARQDLTPLNDYCTDDVVGYSKGKKEFLISFECNCSNGDDIDLFSLEDFSLIIKVNRNVTAFEACEWEKVESVFENNTIKKKIFWCAVLEDFNGRKILMNTSEIDIEEIMQMVSDVVEEESRRYSGITAEE